MTLELEDTDLDVLFSNALGIKRSAMVRRINQIKLMAWEQVLLIAMYARKQYESEGDFHGRMKFTALLNDPSFKALRPHLLPLIDGGIGLLSIMGRLQENLQSWSIEKNLSDYFIRKIEDNGVLFTARPSPFLYSHHDLFIALTRFISICQAMLRLGPSSTICDDLTEAMLRQVFSHEMQPHNTLFDLENLDEPYTLQGQNESITLQTLLTWQEKEQKNTKAPTMLIDEAMARGMQDILVDHFNVRNLDVEIQYNRCMDEEKNIKTRNWVQQKVDSEKNQYNICLDITTLNRFMLMGQHKEISELLVDELHVAVSSQLKLQQSQLPVNAKASPAEWQHACTVLGLSRLDEVPPRIAAILYFDLHHMDSRLYTACREINVPINQPIKREQAEMITTYIIQHCLFNQGIPSDFQNIETQGLVVEKFKCIAEASSNRLPDPMMELWANNTSSKVRSRFKKPLRVFKKELDEIEKLVRNQMSRAMVTPYPIQAGFPAPLWLPQKSQNPSSNPLQEISKS